MSEQTEALRNIAAQLRELAVAAEAVAATVPRGYMHYSTLQNDCRHIDTIAQSLERHATEMPQ